MKMHPARAALVVLLGLGLSACKDRKPDPTPPPPPPPPPVDTTGLSAADRDQFYHLAEGSEILPFFIVRALRNPRTNRPFLQNPERFGLIADPRNRDGLPVGTTADVTVDTRFVGTRMFGFNCASCHVNEVTYRGQAIRLDGAPARFDADTLAGELLAAMKRTATHWSVFWQFMKDVHAYDRRQPGVRGAPGTPETELQPQGELYASLDDADTTAAESALINEIRLAFRRDSAETPPVDIMNVSFDSADASLRQLRARYSVESVAPRAERALQGTRTRTRAAPDPQFQAMVADPRSKRSVQEFIMMLRLLRDRIATIEVIRGQSPGRVDAFGVARNRIFTQNKVPVTGSVSFPHLWGFAQTRWLHYDANTTSVMERNLGQALGVGGVWDRKTFQSTLNPRNIHQLEMIARRIPVPRWPAAFPAIDAAKAAQGEAIFGAQCAGCHADRPTSDVCYPLDRIGTDRNRVVNFALPLNGGTFTAAVAPVLHKLKTEAYRTFKVPPDSQAIMNGIPDNRVVWRTTRAYGVRPLAGVWATAPYLHNGSVPNLYELLQPPARRRKTFPVGHPEYDPDSVGIALTAPPGTKTFDTRQPGNGNGGHTYGTTLTEPQRLALLEYLKGYTGYRGTVTPNNDGIPCPSLTRGVPASR